MRYKVPQNIDMEDRIVGPLTLVQFVYLMVAGMIIYLVYLTFGPTLTFYVISIPLGLVAVGMAFIKVQDQPLPKFIASALLFLVRPKSRVWQKDESVEHVKIVKKTPSKPEEKSGAHTLVAKDELGELASILDTGGTGAIAEVKTEPTLPVRVEGESTELGGHRDQSTEIETRGIQPTTSVDLRNQPPTAATPVPDQPTDLAESEENTEEVKLPDPTAKLGVIRAVVAGQEPPTSPEIGQAEEGTDGSSPR